ncbi:hypothetical protein CMI38_06835 [Candidatus Pacearchaeota archaeon]|jgi:hypothetical protein|nr:hypothetical protein [Candidatus Pacearchaeota archaeon]|tara:strand:+ start:1532 stop:1966 length:435 start_codon:yes stop_codon:yes gene_type:complete
MDIEVIILIVGIFIQLFIASVAFTSLLIIQRINQRIIFNEVVKQERELRIKLNEYREEISKRKSLGLDFNDIALDYDTLLFNYYEYLAISVYKRLINEYIAELYFKTSLIYVKEQFESSILFDQNFANRDEYPATIWLFNNWRI